MLCLGFLPAQLKYAGLTREATVQATPETPEDPWVRFSAFFGWVQAQRHLVDLEDFAELQFPKGATPAAPLTIRRWSVYADPEMDPGNFA